MPYIQAASDCSIAPGVFYGDRNRVKRVLSRPPGETLITPLPTTRGGFVTGNKMPKSAPPKASRERVKAFRNNPDKKRFDVTIPATIAETIDEVAFRFDHSRNDVIVSMLRFALLNRNWKVYGVKP